MGSILLKIVHRFEQKHQNVLQRDLHQAHSILSTSKEKPQCLIEKQQDIKKEPQQFPTNFASLFHIVVV